MAITVWLPEALVQYRSSEGNRLGPGGLISLVLAAVAVISLTAIFVISPPASERGEHITVLAAASMKNALDEVNAAFTKSTGVKVTAGYAASSALIKQIAQGARRR